VEKAVAGEGEGDMGMKRVEGPFVTARGGVTVIGDHGGKVVGSLWRKEVQEQGAGSVMQCLYGVCAEAGGLGLLSQQGVTFRGWLPGGPLSQGRSMST
jgi:hypothetical protein